MCNNNSELKKLYKVDFEKVRQFVKEFDPCGFIHFEFPEDEYDCLTNHLLSAVYANKSREEIKGIVLYEIEFHFETPNLASLSEPYKTEFFNDLEKLIDKLEQHVRKQPCS